MLVDLHAHYPMHLVPGEQQRTHQRLRDWSRQRWQARIVTLISRIANYQGPGGTPSVTEPLMREGGVGVALSVLYAPFDEIDLTQEYGAQPRAGYFSDILDQIALVEADVADRSGRIAVAHSPDELDVLIGQETPALIHCIEGGFQLGSDEASIRDRVRTLSARGVAYITVAHLFWRRVATNAPALPFLPDWLYHRVFPQPDEGLSPLGRAAVSAMVDEGILVDVTHMSERSLDDLFGLLDARDPQGRIPVIATHMACRLGSLEYCLSDATIARIAARGGVLGCILCTHYITNGTHRRVRTLSDSVDALCTHIDHVCDVAGSFDHVAIGSDLDGYIKPALPGLEHMGRMGELQRALSARYGAANARKICSDNALRVLRSAWRAPGSVR